MKKMPDKRYLSDKKISEAFGAAREILANEGGVVEDSPHDYQCFTFKSDDVCLVFYPHKTSAWNYHIRVRDQASKNKEKANRLMELLDEKAGYNCVFTRKVQR